MMIRGYAVGGGEEVDGLGVGDLAALQRRAVVEAGPQHLVVSGHLGMRNPVLHPALAAHALLCCHLHLLATVFICSTIFDLTA